MQYIDRDPVVLKRQKELEKMRKRERNDEERRAKWMFVHFLTF